MALVETPGIGLWSMESREVAWIDEARGRWEMDVGREVKWRMAQRWPIERRSRKRCCRSSTTHASYFSETTPRFLSISQCGIS
jgi:hypothetical protein